MITASKLIPGGLGLAPILLARAPYLELDWEVRQKSRFDAVDSSSRAVGVFLPRGTLVRGGDVLVVEDGSLLRVRAAAQAVLGITACPRRGSPFDLMRAAYHLGNRHVPMQLLPTRLKIEPDHVLAQMLVSMDLDVAPAQEPFEPEGGAYRHASAQGSAHHGAHHDHEQHHGHADAR